MRLVDKIEENEELERELIKRLRELREMVDNLEIDLEEKEEERQRVVDHNQVRYLIMTW